MNISAIILFLESSKYILIFIGCIFEGPVIMLSSGFLYKIGQLSFVPMYITLVLGDFTADILWYLLGMFGTRSTIFKYGHIIKLTPQILEKVENKFRKYHQKILIISKLTMGLGFASVVLVVAGMFKVPFKNYFILNLVGGFIWTAFLVTVGYFFGNIFMLIPSELKITFALGIFLAFLFGIKYTDKYLKTIEI